jgi:hypothetical protein
LYAVALRVQLLLKEVGISLTFLKAKPGGNAVAEADQNRPVRDLAAPEAQKRRNQATAENATRTNRPNVHV